MKVDVNEMMSHADEVAGLLKAIGNKNRLIVLCMLLEGESSVGKLQEQLPLSQSALSQHLAVLRDDGLVSTRREAQTIYYRLTDKRVKKMIAVLHELYCI